MYFGNGQLGRMLGYAGAPLDIYVEPLAFNAPVLTYLKMRSSRQKLNAGKNTFD